MKFFYIFVFFILHSFSVLANDDLLNIVITPTRFEQKIDKTNSFVTVITEKQIKDSSATNLVDFLSSQSSLGIASTGGAGSKPSYFLRGFAKKYIKVTVDGLDVSDPTGTQSETYLQDISLGNIRKIEILKSPQGAIHGGQAGGGVIAITTKSAIYNGSETKQEVQFGSHNTLSSNIYHSYGKNNYKVSANANIYHTDGISSGNKNNLNEEKDAYNYGSVTIKGKMKGSENNVSFVYRESSSKYEYDNWDKTDNHDFSKNNIQSGLVKFEFKTGKKTNHTLSYNPTRVNRRVASSYPSNQSSKQHKVEYIFKKKFDSENLVAFGIEHKNVKYKTSSTREKRESNATFISSQIKISDRSMLDLSIRKDYDQLYGEHNSYRTQYGYKLTNNLKLKISDGTGYRPPSLYEGNNLKSGVTKLKPEKTFNREYGFDYRNIKNALFLSGSYFESSIKDEIDYSGGYFQGTGETDIEGYEISVSKLMSSNLTGQFSYTMTDSDKSNGNKGALVPMHKLSSKFDYKINDQINNQVELIYQERAYDTSGNELPAFSLVNYNLNYKINDNLKSNLKLNNILDQDYQVNRDYGTPGISIYAGVESEYW